MKWVVDRIENSIVVLQNIKTKKMRDIEKSKFSFNISEGMIVKETPKGFVIDKEEKLRKEKMAEKFSKLKKQRD